MSYLVVQWINSGREMIFNLNQAKWSYLPPRYPGLPFSMQSKEALQIITWFFPAWVLGSTIRSGLFEPAFLVRILRVTVYSAGLLALFGVVQFISGTGSIYWITPLDCDFFASFGYSNHAASFFILTGALSAGFVLRECAVEWYLVRKLKLTVFVMILILALIGASFSLSRMGVLMAAGLLIFIIVYSTILLWPKFTPAIRVNYFAVLAAVIILLGMFVWNTGWDKIESQFAPKKTGLVKKGTAIEKIISKLGDRPVLALAAWRIWKDNKLYGVGGWGFRHFVGFYVSQGNWNSLKADGRANTHCDLLQFLAEFGMMGGCLLLFCTIVLFFGFIKVFRWRNPMTVMPLAGVSLVFIHSLIDLPFRCPAIMYTLVVIITAVPVIFLPDPQARED